MTQFLTAETVVVIHDGLAPGAPLIDGGALRGAVGRPMASFGGQLVHSSIYSQASALMHALCQAHAFLDGNKRTAWTATLTFLEMNSVEIAMIDDETMSDYMVQVAEHVVSEDDTAFWLAALDTRNRRDL